MGVAGGRARPMDHRSGRGVGQSAEGTGEAVGVKAPTCHPERKHYARGMCMPCWRSARRRSRLDQSLQYEREYRAQTREARLVAQRRCRYGITPSEYDALMTYQAGVCAICLGPPTAGKTSLGVDHDHRTGAVRGLLCNTCNTFMGQVDKHPHVLTRLAEYAHASNGPVLA